MQKGGGSQRQWAWLVSPNRPVSQMRMPLAACRELALDYYTSPKLLYDFLDKSLTSICATEY